MDYVLREAKQKKFIIVDLTGEIDTLNTDKFAGIFQQLFQAENFNIILNFERVTYINSSGLGIIASNLKKAKENRGELRIINVSEEIYEIFDMVRFTKIIKFYDNEEAALKDVI